MKASKFLPFITIVSTLLVGSSLTIGGYPLLPSLFIIPIYYWLVYRSDLIPLWSLLLLGLFYDALFANEIGVSSILLICSYFFGQYARPLLPSSSFSYIWGGYIIFSLGYTILYSLLTLRGLPVYISWIYGILLYPFVTRGLNFLHLRLDTHD